MKSDLTCGTLLSAILWSMLLLSLFAAPALMAARSADPTPDNHTAELIRQHREATSPHSSAPVIAEDAQIHSNACQEPTDSAMREAYDRDVTPADELMIQPVGNRARRIQV